MKRFFGRIEIRNECLHLTVKVEMYAYIFIYILSNGMTQFMELFKSTDDYETAYNKKILYLDPKNV